MPTVELLTENRDRLLDVKVRTSALDNLVVKSLATVQERFLNAEADDDDEPCEDAADSDYKIRCERDTERTTAPAETGVAL